MEVISLDLVKIDNVILLTFIDLFSRFGDAIIINNKTPIEVMKKLTKELLMRYGTPTIILTDRGNEFISKHCLEVYEDLNIEKRNTTSYHPEGNGIIERFHSTLMQIIRRRAHQEQVDWKEEIRNGIYAYNTIIHSSTGCSPFELFYKRKQKKEKTNNFKTKLIKGITKEVKLNRNDIVKIVYPRRSKMELRNRGPYKINKRISTNTVKITNLDGTKPSIHDIINVDKIAKFNNNNKLTNKLLKSKTKVKKGDNVRSRTRTRTVNRPSRYLTPLAEQVHLLN